MALYEGLEKGCRLLRFSSRFSVSFLDGTSRHLVYFDALKDDEGYDLTIESEPDKMISSHGVKRIVASYHGRGRDELVHRAFKNFGSEELPFKRFAQNSAFYYTMVAAFFLYEVFKEDVCVTVIEVSSYATTVLRKIIDVAGKIMRHAGSSIFKITGYSCKHLDFYELWAKSGNPPRLMFS